jgi:hypothetical protein
MAATYAAEAVWGGLFGGFVGENFLKLCLSLQVGVVPAKQHIHWHLLTHAAAS